MRWREVGVRAAGEDHQPLLRPALDPVARLRLGHDVAAPRGPGSTSSVVALPGCIALLVLLARPGDPRAHLRGRPSVMTDPAAIHAPSPISTGATKPLWMPVLTLLPIVVRPFGRPGLCGKLAVIAPAPMFVSVADLGVADVRQMGHLRAVPDA